MRGPGSDRELDVVGSEESDTVAIPDVPAGFHDVSERVGTSSDLLKVVTPARLVVNQPWRSLGANRSVWVMIVEEELGNGHVGGNVRDSAVGGDEFLDGLLRHGGSFVVD